ncbi:MAG: PAS domain S-box protein [Bacteroidales bacterium]|jgi:PAS domain S-box-containing protein|nr:PAS domain S-box protein [Bacteroidales bacterium]
MSDAKGLMRKWLSIVLITFSFPFTGIYGQHTPLDKCVLDSLYRVMPHENQIQNAEILLETAQVIWDSLPEKALSCIESAQKISIIEGSSLMKARSRRVFGEYYKRRQQFFRAQVQFLAALSIFNEYRDTIGELTTLENIGDLNFQLENNTKALEYFQRGITLAGKARNDKVCGKFHNLTAIVYQRMGDTSLSLFHFNKALTIYKLTGSKTEVIMVRSNIGSLLMDQKRFNEALAYFQVLLHDSDTYDGVVMGVLYTRIGHIYQQLKQFRNSLNWDLKALMVRRVLKAPYPYVSSMINVAGDYFQMGKPDSGNFYMDKGMSLAKKYYLKNFIQNGYRHLFNYYARVNNYQKALESYQQYAAVSDSILSERNLGNISIIEDNQRIARVEESNKFLTRQNEIQTLNLTNQKSQYSFVRLLAVVGIIFMIIILTRLLYNRRLRQNMQELYQRLTREKKECETLQQQTRVREQQYRFLAENSIDFITLVNSKKERIYASPSSKEIYGYEPGEILHKNLYDLAHPDFLSYSEENFSEMLKTRKERQFVYLAQKKNGMYFWVESILNPIFDRLTGELKELVGVTRDIQERKIIELEIMEGTKQKENLLKEIHHRVKNNFAILVSLINMQMDQSNNPELRQSLSNLQLRIRTMALVHEMLYRSKDFEKISFPDYLRSLASVVAGTYNRRDIHVSFETDETVMDIESSIPLGLIINEILSNVYKHAFPDGKPGNIRILLKKKPDRPIVCLTIHDNGIGLPINFSLEQCPTMGLQIVQILGRQLEGDIVLKNDEGTLFTLCFQHSVDQKSS